MATKTKSLADIFSFVDNIRKRLLMWHFIRHLGGEATSTHEKGLEDRQKFPSKKFRKPNARKSSFEGATLLALTRPTAPAVKAATYAKWAHPEQIGENETAKKNMARASYRRRLPAQQRCRNLRGHCRRRRSKSRRSRGRVEKSKGASALRKKKATGRRGTPAEKPGIKYRRI